jgi:hypothetical protein
MKSHTIKVKDMWMSLKFNDKDNIISNMQWGICFDVDSPCLFEVERVHDDKKCVLEGKVDFGNFYFSGL